MSAASPRPVWRSTIGLKVVMALTGFGLVAFVLAHMAGHLIVFQGQDAYNDYAQFLQGLGGIKWAARAGLLAIFVLHIWSAVHLARRNRSARAVDYERLVTRRTNLHAQYMLGTGVVALLFVVYHLAHFTFGWVHAAEFAKLDQLGRPDVYNNFVISFQSPLIVLLYTAAIVALASHLAHATTSVFRTLGLSHGRFKEPLRWAGPAVAVVSLVGYLVVPFACLFGIVDPVGR